MSFDPFVTNTFFLKTFITQLDCPVIYISADQVCLAANNFVFKLFQIDQDQLIGVNFDEFCEKHKSSLYLLNPMRNTQVSIEESYQMQELKYIISWESLICPSNTDVFNGYFLIGHVITGYKALCDHLKSKVYFYENILSKLPTNVYWKDRNSVYLGCNDRLAHVMGLPSRESIKGMTDYDFDWGEGAAESFIAFDQKVMQSGMALTTEDTFKEADGKLVTVLTNKTPLKNENGETIGILAISADITDRKRAEVREKKALLEAAEAKTKAQLEENLRLAVTVVAGRIAHDIRTPLNILLRKSENLKDLMPIVLEAYKKAEESDLDIEDISSGQYDYLQSIPDAVENEINKLNQFISSILKTLSKVVTGEISRDDLEVFWIHGVIGRALREYPYTDDDERSLIEYKRGANFTFLGNDILLIYAFYNLIKNSLYQIEKNKKGKIYITTEVGEEANFVRFKDTAGGVSPEIVKQFFSGYKTTKQEGTGLGLASIKQTMQLFGGDITCNSEEGEFIEFIFSFPKLENNIQS